MAQPDFVSRSDCQRVVAAGFAHLVGLVGPKGRFVYAHPMGRPDAPLEGYNLLRHCGTLWFMLRALNEMALDLTDPDKAALSLIPLPMMT